MAKAKKSQKAPSLLSRVEKSLSGLLHGDPTTDILQAILLDHEDLKSLLKQLKDPEVAMPIKVRAFERFRALLNSHSVAEEKALYTLSRHLPNLELKTEEGWVEHRVAKDLLSKIKTPGTSSVLHWKAQVQVLAELVEHHLKEEERDLLPEIRKQVDARTRETQARVFMRLRAKSQKTRGRDNEGALAKSPD